MSPFLSGTPWPNLETGAGPADHYLPPAHRTLWSECPSEEDWHFRHFPLWVRTRWPNARPHPAVLPKICRETSANMAAGCWSGDQAVGLSRRPLLDGWFCGINRTEDLTCTAVDRWRRRRSQVIFRTNGSSSNEAKVGSSVDLDEERRQRKMKMSSTSPETDKTLKCIALVQDRRQLWQKEHR